MIYAAFNVSHIIDKHKQVLVHPNVIRNRVQIILGQEHRITADKDPRKDPVGVKGTVLLTTNDPLRTAEKPANIGAESGHGLLRRRLMSEAYKGDNAWPVKEAVYYSILLPRSTACFIVSIRSNLPM